MGDNFEYAQMLDIPVKSVNVTVKNANKPKRQKKNNDVKKEVVAKVNAKTSKKENEEKAPLQQDVKNATDEPLNLLNIEQEVDLESEIVSIDGQEENSDFFENENEKNEQTEEFFEEEIVLATKVENVKAKKSHSFSIIKLEVAMIVLLVAIIGVSTMLIPNNGLNTIFNMVINGQTEEYVNDDEYNSFSASITTSASIADGVIEIAGKQSIYAPCDGTISSLVYENGKYVMEITHSTNFKSVISGIDYAYGSVDSKVYKNMPIGFLTDDTVTICMYSTDGLITNYTVDNGNIIWQV